MSLFGRAFHAVTNFAVLCVLDQPPHDSDTSNSNESIPALYLEPFEKGQQLVTRLPF